MSKYDVLRCQLGIETMKSGSTAEEIYRIRSLQVLENHLQPETVVEVIVSGLPLRERD